MPNPQHVYRRGATFWWRRVHRLLTLRVIEVRISLKTKNLSEARNKGAVLSSHTTQVIRMLNARIRSADEHPNDEDLRAIAGKVYNERLAQWCSEQLAQPDLKQEFQIANQSAVDFYGRLAENGGQLPIRPEEVAALREEDWGEKRIERLVTNIDAAASGEITPIQPRLINRYLKEIGFEKPTEAMHAMVLQVLYPVYRDAALEANRRLMNPQSYPLQQELNIRDLEPGRELTAQSVPDKWLAATPTQAAEMYIQSDGKLSGFRLGGKREEKSVGEQTLRQIRWAATLLEKSLPTGTPFWKVTVEDFRRLDQWFEEIHVNFGKSEHDRTPEMTLERAASATKAKLEKGLISPDSVGLSAATTNKHFNKLAQIYDFMREEVQVREINFERFTIADPKDQRNARPPLADYQIEAMFKLPPWTGCHGPAKRLNQGKHIFHDSLFFVPLIAAYTGARREEICKLSVSDFNEMDGIHYFVVDFTPSGRVKNESSARCIPVSEELIRLGLIKYVDALRNHGETMVFPELRSEGKESLRKMGDVFYKEHLNKVLKRIPDIKPNQGMHALRHSVSTSLKEKEVFPEFRKDLMGHASEGDAERRYASLASIRALKKTVEQIPVFTTHIPQQDEINLLPPLMRIPKKARTTKQQDS